MDPNNDKALFARNGGASTKLTRKLAQHICATIAASPHSLLTLCEQHSDWPRYQELGAMRERLPWFRAMYSRARAAQAEVILHDNLRRGEKLLEQPGDMARVQAHRIVFEDRRWWAGRVDRSQWGDDPGVSIQNQQAVVVTDDQLQDLRKRLAERREKPE